MDDEECKWMLPMNESRPSEKSSKKKERDRKKEIDSGSKYAWCKQACGFYLRD